MDSSSAGCVAFLGWSCRSVGPFVSIPAGCLASGWSAVTCGGSCPCRFPPLFPTMTAAAATVAECFLDDAC